MNLRVFNFDRNSRELLRQLDHVGTQNGVEVEPMKEKAAGAIDRVSEDAESKVEEVKRCFEIPRGPRPVHRLGKRHVTQILLSSTGFALSDPTVDPSWSLPLQINPTDCCLIPNGESEKNEVELGRCVWEPRRRRFR